ncbi:anaerobic sulfatase maturase [Paenibacillus selenitireducens]|uniref:Anaerobic sulfatase maturase n=1 Tax=Paenibacillus selenitireducens TaxID=1324314 RepID=A0A1T2XK42_9BACL|nr:anaerobic sulfatase maturase [Paenibacillus selenitireducens]OPA80214.1 anaerobic sulfatase maturase [Paenibacillus selenitireducens]
MTTTCQTTRQAVPASLLWKTVSEDCNLACDYCYYSSCKGQPSPEIRRIEDSLLQKVIREMMEQSRGFASFAWQGGEPLLAGLDFFQKVVQLQAQYAPRNTVISNALQTNGTLINPAWAAFFRQYSFLIGVSMDGPAWIHDQRRKTGSGAGSYASVMRGIEVLRQEKVEFNILTVIHETNVLESAALTEWIDQNRFKYVQFIPGMDFRSQDVGAEGKYLITPKQYGQFLCEILDWWYRDGEPDVSVRILDNWLQRLIGEEAESCIHRSECPSVLVMEQNGAAYPCDFYIHDDYRLGAAGEQSLASMMLDTSWEKFRSQKGNLADACRSCAYLHYCHGGCPRNRVQGFDHDKPGQDYLCESYRMLYAYGEERMRKLAKKIVARLGRRMPARNELCLCGSGRKYKQCCGH